MDYGDAIYMHSPSSTIKPLDVVYHFALRFVTWIALECIVVYYEKVGWPSLAMRREQDALALCTNHNHNQCTMLVYIYCDQGIIAKESLLSMAIRVLNKDE